MSKREMEDIIEDLKKVKKDKKSTKKKKKKKRAIKNRLATASLFFHRLHKFIFCYSKVIKLG